MMDRRRFLTGASGAVVALPFVGALLPRSAWAQAEAKVNTFVMRNGNGVAQAWGGSNGSNGGAVLPGEPERFFPRNVGPLTQQILEGSDSDRAVSELSAYADKLLIVTGTKHGFAHQSCAHAQGLVQSLTGANYDVPAGKGGRESLATGRSIDWEIAAHMSPGVAPLNLRAGMVYSGPNTPRSQTATYSAPLVKVDGEYNPYTVYKSLFGLGNVDTQTQQALFKRRVSVNDLVRRQMNDLLGKATLGAADKSRLRKHFDAIRDLEIRLTGTLSTDQVDAMENITAAADADDNRLTIAEMQIDIAALAFASDLTRVATLQIGTIGDGTRYRVNGQLVTDFHLISHRVSNDDDPNSKIPNADKLHHEIDRLFLRTFRHMADRLAEYDILDQSLCYWTNDLAHGVTHGGEPVPQVVLGNAGGRLRTGTYFDAGGVAHNKFLSTLLAATGARASNGDVISFGDSSLPRGVFTELLA